MMLTQSRLKEVLHYNPETGIFTRKIDRLPYLKGSIAGHLHKKSGYIKINVDGKTHGAHRLPFLYMLGYLPEGQVDHKDRVRHHNWWDNLREASPQCQARNSELNFTNTSGVKGVHWYKDRKKWQVLIKINQKMIHLGLFVDKVEAVAHRFAAEQCLNWSDCNINSTAGQFLKENINKF